MLTSVFLSYATAAPDGQVAKAIHNALTKSGIKIPAWRDREKLRGGDRFSEKFARAIRDAESFLFLLSPRSVASKWCRRELSRADGLEKPIIPLLLEEVSRETLPIELERLQYIDFRKGARHGLPGLRNALGLTPVREDVLDDPTARDDRLVQALAQTFRYGDNFAPVPNMVILVQQIGTACAETTRAQRVFQKLIPAGYRSGRDAADWLVAAWNGPPTQ
jgi:hypothetical protein